MKLILIFGPQAVGKMTVGKELENITGLKLFHNHMTIDLVLKFFDFGTTSFMRLVNSFRFQIMEEVAQSNQEGLIFTYVWAFDQQEDWDFVDHISSIFEQNGGEVYYVELEAELNERLGRNKSPYRLEQKPTKRDVDFSERELKSSMDEYRLNSLEGELKKKNYLRMDNTLLSAKEVAEKIKQTFVL
ncbi:DEAD/DEAH box helicase family protein [Salinibacillus xinjiangensis]|uniref:AAA family ATPase n=1 Tax=Salinibacillus xinjiangensis TaxID=1229268 RepID=A0A6G1X2W7_9BACI|nr:AAA family ATPase [Salinibacillus xinjiangensis]MRG85245.1 AAA family ATPase [Salinibacillus xinjiangensis]